MKKVKMLIKKEHIEGLLKDQLAKIKNKKLREKVVKVWLSACEKGDWDLDHLMQAPFTLLTDSHNITLIEHTVAVTEGALALAQAQEKAYGRKLPFAFNLDYLVAGGLLHDIGKLLEIDGMPTSGYHKSHIGECIRHPISGACLAYRVDIPWEIINSIACHAKEGEGRPKTVETILIHQADFATFDPLKMYNDGQLIR